MTSKANRIWKKYTWYLNRLSTMSAPEIAYRIKEEARKHWEQRFAFEPTLKMPFSDATGAWYFSQAESKKIVDLIPAGNKELTLQKADALLNHTFSFLALSPQHFGETIDWHRDYRNNKQSPKTFCKSINYRDFDLLGDIKYIWELNRHQHLVTLAKAHFITQNDVYKREVINQLDSWFAANPYLVGVNWASSLELALRLISWSWTWSFLGTTDTAFSQRWLDSIYKHCVYLSVNFSRFSSANNHLIGEAAGLFIASTFWPLGQDSKIWQRTSYDILVSEIEKQVCPDGVSKEQTVHYQQFVLDLFFLAALLGEKNGISFPKPFWHRIEKMIEFLVALLDVGGNLPNIGDADDGYAIILTEAPAFNPFKSLIATGATHFNRGDLKKTAQAFDEKSLWLSGGAGYTTFINLPGHPPHSCTVFSAGGYFVLSTEEGTENEIKIVFDCGPLGYLGIAAHGHADALSFTLSVAGREFLIDPGTYSYHTERAWRDYFRGTLAHNTVRIDGLDQSVSGGAFMWLKKAEPRLLGHSVTDTFETVKASHNGYSRLSDPVTHDRELILDKKNQQVIIIDHITAAGLHVIEQMFHFSPDCRLEAEADSRWAIHNGEQQISMIFPEGVHTQVYRGTLTPILGWHSKHLGIKNPTSTLVAKGETAGGCEIKTIIVVNSFPEHS
jgi:uncharacterized heparinase superfamily protein